MVLFCCGTLVLWYCDTLVLFCCSSVVEKWYDGAGSGKSIRESQNLPVRITLPPSCTQWIWKRVFSTSTILEMRKRIPNLRKGKSHFQNLDTRHNSTVPPACQMRKRGRYRKGTGCAGTGTVELTHCSRQEDVTN